MTEALLTSDQVRRIYAVTDDLGLHRNWIVLPLTASPAGRERILPDGKLFLAAPGGTDFEGWFSALRERLKGLNLQRTPRKHQEDPTIVNTPSGSLPGSGARRYLNLTPPLKQSWRGGGAPPSSR